MSIWLCDKCVVNRIKNGECKPLGAYYLANKIPFKNDNCEDCGSKENIQKVPLDLTPMISAKGKKPDSLTVYVVEDLQINTYEFVADRPRRPADSDEAIYMKNNNTPVLMSSKWVDENGVQTYQEARTALVVELDELKKMYEEELKVNETKQRQC